eukprot:TRINITY_DN8182_c0_g2_i8.p1 TRINITY_DN8182_c0_g2~~TRINITY_DN8182_c0_g2_i8.p1  ORF type:complete len:588 (-),score=151.59 TRINITY_DN8182_c0_g2_i8:53-1816(-)
MIRLAAQFNVLRHSLRPLSTQLMSDYSGDEFEQLEGIDNQWPGDIDAAAAEKELTKMLERAKKMLKSDSKQGTASRDLGIYLQPKLINVMENAKVLDYQSFPMNCLQTPPELEGVPIPRLCNGLERVAKSHGLINRDCLSSVVKSNVTDFYKSLPTPEEIDNEMIGEYIPPSKDKLLFSIAEKCGAQYMLSTSTVTSLLAHIDYLITNFRSPLFSQLSHEYVDEPLKYIISARKPSTGYATVVNAMPRVIAIDSDSGFLDESSLIFLRMGRYLELMITQNQSDFNRKFLLKNKSRRLPGDRPVPDYHSFLKAGKMLLRSQIDAGIVEGDFLKKVEIKTRAIMAQRYDAEFYKNYLDYRLRTSIGLYESYEREYYDLIRSAFNKYLHQMMIGGMDGVLVAYHNTQEIFGFEYLDRWHLEKRMYGSQEFARICFKTGLALLQNIFEYIFRFEEMKKIGEVAKIGFYASNMGKNLVIMVEKIKNVADYKKQLRNSLENPKFPDVVDYYKSAKIVPDVSKYIVTLSARLNGVVIPNGISVFFETKDDLEYTYNICRAGKVEMGEYMDFLHEAYKANYRNVENEYMGTWHNT